MRQRDVINLDDPGQPFRDFTAAFSREIVDAYVDLRDVKGAADFQRDMIDALESMAPDGMGKDWRKAVRSQKRNPAGATQWKARALNLDATDPHMAIAMACFAPMKRGDGWALAVPLPLPCPMGPKFAEPEEIILIDTATGAASAYGSDGSFLIPAASYDRFAVMADAKAWAREIATHIVEWFYRCDLARREANIGPAWDGYPPSALAIGDIGKIRWPHVDAITARNGVDAAALKKAIFRQARITRVESPMQIVRAA